MGIRKEIVALWLLIAAATIWLFETRYTVRENAGAQVVCKSRECYLFIAQGKDGWKANGFRLIANHAVAMLGGANSPTDARAETLVLAVRANSVQRYWFPGSLSPDKIYRGQLYVRHVKQADVLKRNRNRGRVLNPDDYAFGQWTGTTLDPINAAQKKEVDRAQDGLWANKGDSSEPGLWRGSLDGWVWIYSLPFDHPVRIDLADGPVTLTRKDSSLIPESYTSESIILKTDDGHEQTLWTMNQRQHRVSRDEYVRAFGGRP